MKNMFCDSKSLNNEASVERCFVERLLSALGFEDADIRPKTALREIKIGRGSKSELYKPDYILMDRGVPVVVVDAKDVNEPLGSWTLQCSSYCLELNKRFDYNPVHYYVLTNGIKTSVYSWDKEAPLLSLDFAQFELDNDEYKKLRNLISRRALSRRIEEQRERSETADFKIERIALDLLISKFQKIHNYIWKKEKKKPSSVFEELIKLVFVKIRKDKELHAKFGNHPIPPTKDVVFSTQWIDGQTQSENPVNDVLFRNLIGDLEEDIQRRKKKRIFDEHEQINLSPDTIRWVVKELEHIDLFGMEEDVHGRMFESFLEATARGKELGQFFTPRDVVNLMVSLADIRVELDHVDKVLDACCGSGGFLIQAMADMVHKVSEISGASNRKRAELTSVIQNKSIYGIDAGSDPKIYRIARMNMYLHGDGGSHIYFADSLDKRIGMIGRTSAEYKQETQEIRSILNENKLRFEVILSNPPFSMKYAADDADQTEVLEQYDLSHLNGRKVKSLLSSVMFLERYKDFVSEDGRILAIIDESVLSGESYREVRQWIRDTFLIEAVISLPGDAFRRSAARVKTSILILRLKKVGEEQPDVFLDYAIRLGLERKTARRIGINPDTLAEKKALEAKRIATDYKAFRAGRGKKHVYPASAISDRLDVKFCIRDKGRKKKLWERSGHIPIRFGQILSTATNRSVEVSDEEDYQFLRVNYQGDVIDGEVIPGAECSYRHLYKTEIWDILISNMGVGRGAIGIVPPYHANKFVSSEYTILRAKTHPEAVYYSNLIKTKEILGDVLSSTTGMNRGRIEWDVIAEVEVPQYRPGDEGVAGLVRALEQMWNANLRFAEDRKRYLGAVAGEMDLNGMDAQERWLGFKPPE